MISSLFYRAVILKSSPYLSLLESSYPTFLDLNQSRVEIMNHAAVEENYKYKLISALNCGELAAVMLSFQNIF